MSGDPISGDQWAGTTSIVRRLVSFVGWVFFVLVVTPIVLICIVVFLPVLAKKFSTYTESNKFSHIVEIEETLASKRLHSWSGPSLQCHFEAVRFSDASAARFRGPNAIDAIDIKGRGNRKRTLVLKPTPMKPESEMRGGEQDGYYCMLTEDQELTTLLRRAAQTPGSWYSDSGSGMLLIVPEHRIATWGAFGD